MYMPEPDEHHRKLAAFEGVWEGEETMAGPPNGPGGSFGAKTTFRMAVDGKFLVQDYAQLRGGHEVYHGHGVIGWDGERKEYAWYWVDTMGNVPAAPSYGPWDGDTLSFSHAKEGRAGRYSYRFVDKDTLTFSIDNSEDGGKTWNNLLQGKYKRAA